MPTVLNSHGFRFFFFSHEGAEPPHIHIEHGDKVAKYWLNPVDLAMSGVQKSRIDAGSCAGDRAPYVFRGEVA
jgi:hypothetical protein